MTASPAEIANDLEAQAAFFRKRDEDIALLCRDCARLIREMLAGERIDGRTYGGVHRRLLDRCAKRNVAPGTQIGKSLLRGLVELQALHGDAGP